LIYSLDFEDYIDRARLIIKGVTSKKAKGRERGVIDSFIEEEAIKDVDVLAI